MNFASDNVYGVDPRIMQAMVEANARPTDVSYCHDDGAKAAEARLSEVFEKDVSVFFVMNGTGANALALSAICPPYGGILCHEGSHINTDECNCPELFTGGAKLVTVGGDGNKITMAGMQSRIAQFVHGEHGAKLAALSLSNVTELGTIYTQHEIEALTGLARSHKLKCHMDGARFANALVALGCKPAEMTWKAGIDVLSFGGTKNGGMMLEAVVFFDTSLAEDFLYRRKRAGQLLSKGRYLSAQMLAYLEDDLWLENARNANRLAARLAKGLQASNHVRLSNTVQANEVFAVMPRKTYAAMTAAGAHFFEWPVDDMSEHEVHCRFVLSFATPQADVDQFLRLLGQVSLTL